MNQVYLILVFNDFLSVGKMIKHTIQTEIWRFKLFLFLLFQNFTHFKSQVWHDIEAVNSKEPDLSAANRLQPEKNLLFAFISGLNSFQRLEETKR